MRKEIKYCICYCFNNYPIVCVLPTSMPPTDTVIGGHLIKCQSIPIILTEDSASIASASTFGRASTGHEFWFPPKLRIHSTSQDRVNMKQMVRNRDYKVSFS
jgi:hypothetical protein